MVKRPPPRHGERPGVGFGAIRRRGGDGQPATLAWRRRVEGQVHHDLLELGAVGGDGVEVRRQQWLDRDVLADQSVQHLMHVADDHVQVHHGHFQRLPLAER